jgi:hypothetical protein
MPDEIDWTLTTWEGNRRRQHEDFLALSFREKVALIEQLGEVSEFFRRKARVVDASTSQNPGQSSSTPREG